MGRVGRPKKSTLFGNKHSPSALVLRFGAEAAIETSKEALLKEASGLRELARQARRMVLSFASEDAQRRILRHAVQLEHGAAQLEAMATHRASDPAQPKPAEETGDRP